MGTLSSELVIFQDLDENGDSNSLENQFSETYLVSLTLISAEMVEKVENLRKWGRRTQIVDFWSGLQLFRDKMGIRKNGDVFQNLLLFLSKMGSHFIKKIL